MTDHDAEADAIVAELEAAGLVTVGTDAEGQETWTLTEMGVQLARQMSMSSEDDAAALPRCAAGCAGLAPLEVHA